MNRFLYFLCFFFSIFVVRCHLLCDVLLTFLFIFVNFQDWDSQNGSQIATELCGFVTILSGTFLLHKTKDMGSTPAVPLPAAELTRQFSGNCNHEHPKHSSRNPSPDRNFRE